MKNLKNAMLEIVLSGREKATKRADGNYEVVFLLNMEEARVFNETRELVSEELGRPVSMAEAIKHIVEAELKELHPDYKNQ